jgi:hypothetical protein
MTKRASLALVLVSAAALAHEGHHATKKSDARLTGEIVDITCYLDHESKGEKHASCARKCIEGGMPVGIIADGQLYVVIMSGHQSPNAKLAPYAGRLVSMSGKRIERDGLRAIDMEDVRPISPDQISNSQ